MHGTCRRLCDCNFLGKHLVKTFQEHIWEEERRKTAPSLYILGPKRVVGTFFFKCALRLNTFMNSEGQFGLGEEGRPGNEEPWVPARAWSVSLGRSPFLWPSVLSCEIAECKWYAFSVFYVSADTPWFSLGGNGEGRVHAEGERGHILQVASV